MILDLPKALKYLEGDHTLLHALMEMFGHTLSDLESLLYTTSANDAEAWAAFYHALHGAKPTLTIFGSDPFNALVSRMCEYLAASDYAHAGMLTESLSAQLRELNSDIVQSRQHAS